MNLVLPEGSWVIYAAAPFWRNCKGFNWLLAQPR